jgi:hypothetical protein
MAGDAFTERVQFALAFVEHMLPAREFLKRR